MYVYILNKAGRPLMPTTRCGHVRILLKQNKARVVKRRPFTVQLLYECKEAEARVILGIDPGRTNVGLCAVNEKGKPLLSINAQTRNKDVPKLMKERKAHRSKHRRLGRRCVRQRRAKAAGTSTCKDIERILPGHEKPVVCKGIKNKEARFSNRKREERWLTPTANHLLKTHMRLVEMASEILPITDVVLEVNKFAFMAMDNPNVKPWQYQGGQLHSYDSVNDAVYEQQDGRCLLCGRGIEHYHHIVPQRNGGSDTLPNIAGLCKSCHDVVHKDAKTEAVLKSKKEGLNKKYGALSVLNQIVPALCDNLASMFSKRTYVTEGMSTKAFRDEHHFEKDHCIDAYCIACSVLDDVKASVPTDFLEIRQFRRHDRQACNQENIDRKYKDKSGVIVASNRHKRMEQKTDSLEEYRLSHGEKDVSRLEVEKRNAQYKDMERIMPGALMKDVKTNKLFVLASFHGRKKGNALPDYYVDTKRERHTASKCVLLKQNTGLVFV